MIPTPFKKGVKKKIDLEYKALVTVYQKKEENTPCMCCLLRCVVFGGGWRVGGWRYTQFWKMLLFFFFILAINPKNG